MQTKWHRNFDFITSTMKIRLQYLLGARLFNAEFYYHHCTIVVVLFNQIDILVFSNVTIFLSDGIETGLDLYSIYLIVSFFTLGLILKIKNLYSKL